MSVPNIFAKYFGKIDVAKLDENFDYLFNTQASIPTGLVAAFATSTVPTGWLKCNGAALNTITYAALFAKINYTYGGSGSSFNLPDLRGEFIRGHDDGRGVDSGRTLGSLQTEMIGPHNHQQTNNGADVDTGSLAAYQHTSGTTYGPYTAVDSTASTKNNTGTENRPRNVAMMYCIKY